MCETRQQLWSSANSPQPWTVFIANLTLIAGRNVIYAGCHWSALKLTNQPRARPTFQHRRRDNAVKSATCSYCGRRGAEGSFSLYPAPQALLQNMSPADSASNFVNTHFGQSYETPSLYSTACPFCPPWFCLCVCVCLRVIISMTLLIAALLGFI